MIYRCLFCGKNHDQVLLLIAGPTPTSAAICDECVALSQEIVNEKRYNWPSRALKRSNAHAALVESTDTLAQIVEAEKAANQRGLKAMADALSESAAETPNA